LELKKIILKYILTPVYLTGVFYFYIFVKKLIMYVIVKHIKMNDNKKRVPVIILNSDSEILEFETLESAERMREIFELNSDSGHVYEVKKI
jgi:hypothetical protein